MAAEEKVKKTFNDLRLFFNIGAQYVTTPENRLLKISGLITKLLKKYQPIVDEYNGELEDERDLLCSVDDKKNMIYEVVEQQRFRIYTTENRVKLNKIERQIFKDWKEKEFDIDPLYINETDIPDNLTDYEIELFTGFVIRPGYARPLPDNKISQTDHPVIN